MILKKLSALLLGAACLAISVGAAVGCGENEPEPEKEELMTYHEYNLKTYLSPLWKGEVVYNETLWFAGSQTASLMYEPTEIVSVMSYDLKTTFEEDTDYIVDGKDIIIPENGKIPYLSPSELYRTSPMNSFVQALRRGEDGQPDGYIYADEGSTISAQQVVVTYRHKDQITWNLPKVETAKFPKTMAKLNGGEKIKVLFYGDSITVGANSSGYIGYEPHAESYANMVKSYMQKRFPSATIDFKNNAVGGTDRKSVV